MSNIVRFVLALLGISGAAFIVTDMLRNWKIVNSAFSPAWLIIPLNVLFISREVVNSAWIRQSGKISAKTLRYMSRALEILVIFLFIILLVSIPFVWNGAIDTVSGSADAVIF